MDSQGQASDVTSASQAASPGDVATSSRTSSIGDLDNWPVKFENCLCVAGTFVPTMVLDDIKFVRFDTSNHNLWLSRATGVKRTCMGVLLRNNTVLQEIIQEIRALRGKRRRNTMKVDKEGFMQNDKVNVVVRGHSGPAADGHSRLSASASTPAGAGLLPLAIHACWLLAPRLLAAHALLVCAHWNWKKIRKLILQEWSCKS